MKDHPEFLQGILSKRNSCSTHDVSGAILVSGSVIYPEFAEFFQVLDPFPCLSTRHLETSWCPTSSARSLEISFFQHTFEAVKFHQGAPFSHVEQIGTTLDMGNHGFSMGFPLLQVQAASSDLPNGWRPVLPLSAARARELQQLSSAAAEKYREMQEEMGLDVEWKH